MQIGERLELLLDLYRRPDGRRWNGQQIQDATGDEITRSYLSALRNGHIPNPGVQKLRAIADAVGFPPELWFRDIPGETGASRLPKSSGDTITQRLEHLFATVIDERTGEPHTSAEIAHRTLGELSEQEIEAMRSGELGNPTVRQVVILSEAFGVGPSYLLEKQPWRDAIDPLITTILTNDKSRDIAVKSMDLSEDAQDLILQIIARFGDTNGIGNRHFFGDRNGVVDGGSVSRSR